MTPAQLTERRVLFAFDTLDEGVAVAIDDHREHQRPATDRAILDQRLAPAGGRVDAERILFPAARADVERVCFERHYGWGVSNRAATAPPYAAVKPSATLPIA